MATNLSKNTAKLMLKKLRTRLDNLFNEQEQLKQSLGLDNSGKKKKYGGSIRKFWDGGSIFKDEDYGGSSFNRKTNYDPMGMLGNTDSFEDLNAPFYPRGASQMDPSIQSTYSPEGNPSAAIQDVIPRGGNSVSIANNPDINQRTGGNQYGADWGNIGLSALSMAPNIYNLAQALKPAEQLNASDYYNPQYNKAIGLMSNRRFNINPGLDALRTSERIGARDIGQVSKSSGQYLSNRLGLNANRMRGERELYSQKQNMDNQYMAEEAQMRTGLGSERAQTKLSIKNLNLQSQAARRNYGAAAASGFGTWADKQILNKNRGTTDEMLLDIARLRDPWFAEKYPNINTYKSGRKLKKVKYQNKIKK